jgi:hypothetical protein
VSQNGAMAMAMAIMILFYTPLNRFDHWSISVIVTTCFIAIVLAIAAIMILYPVCIFSTSPLF